MWSPSIHLENLFKGGSQTERDTYRPISTLPCISKEHESFANTEIQGFSAETGLISDHQFANTSFSSSTVTLIVAVDSWKFAINKGEKVVCTFLGLRKAFVKSLSDWKRAWMVQKLLTGEKPIRVLRKCRVWTSFNHTRSSPKFSYQTYFIQHQF